MKINLWENGLSWYDSQNGYTLSQRDIIWPSENYPAVSIDQCERHYEQGHVLGGRAKGAFTLYKQEEAISTFAES